MTKTLKLVLASTMLICAAPLAQAQGVVRGAREGASEGAHAAGPVGGLVGGVVGGVTGGVAGLLGVDQRPRFHEYVVRQHHPSYHYRGRVVVGTVLPPTVTYYVAPQQYDIPAYRYAIVDGHTVLVEPRTRRIVQIVD